jgi:NAD(P)-dependent dehydrogenase (short-subunit alcohol dehydrogenase family)
MRFDGRVAIVTGAGGKPGLGRSHAMLLAERGAKIVVNDLGVGSDGTGAAPHSAENTVAEITDAGGEAIADLHSVAEEESARQVVQTALDAWGRVDILVNNAGVAVVGTLQEISSGDLQMSLKVHLMGDVWMCRAVWPHMIEAGYGRIVNTTSGAMYGAPGMPIYSAAKFGIYGLTRGLAVEGVEHNIKVNAMSPGGFTNSFDPFFKLESEEIREQFISALPPELVSPVVAYLSHEDCEVNGGLFDVAGGQITSTALTASAGFYNSELTIEDVRDNLDTILRRSDDDRVITDARDPLGTINEQASMVSLKPYKARF